MGWQNGAENAVGSIIFSTSGGLHTTGGLLTVLLQEVEQRSKSSEGYCKGRRIARLKRMLMRNIGFGLLSTRDDVPVCAGPLLRLAISVLPRFCPCITERASVKLVVSAFRQSSDRLLSAGILASQIAGGVLLCIPEKALCSSLELKSVPWDEDIAMRCLCDVKG